jgi:hypothetical protein
VYHGYLPAGCTCTFREVSQGIVPLEGTVNPPGGLSSLPIRLTYLTYLTYFTYLIDLIDLIDLSSIYLQLQT